MSEPKSRGTNLSVNMDGLGFSDRDENLLIKEEYKIWKNNCPHLYDVVSTHALKWPSLTIQWFPTIDEQRNKNYLFHEILLGTQTLGEDPNYLIKAEVGLPLEISDDDNDNNNVADGAINNNFRIVKMIKHCGNVNIARYMPQKPSIIASKNDGDEVYIFDCNEQSSMPSNGRVNPELRLLGHKTEGFSLSWSIFKSGHLLSGANDSLICWWDTNATTQNRTLDPLRVFKFNEDEDEDAVNHVAWHMKNENLFGSVGGNKLQLWDIREPSINNPVQYCVAHSDTINCMDFNPFNEWGLATGSTDKTIRLWDTRKINKSNNLGDCVHTCKQSSGAVLQVGWNPNNEMVFASGCNGRRVYVWDLSRIGEIQTPEDAEDGVPEMLFIHGGHTSKINDLSWHPSDEMMIASVAHDNLFHVWKMGEWIYKDEEEFSYEESHDPVGDIP